MSTVNVYWKRLYPGGVLASGGLRGEGTRSSSGVCLKEDEDVLFYMRKLFLILSEAA